MRRESGFLERVLWSASIIVLSGTVPAALGAELRPVTEVEEVVTKYVAPNNGAGPTWCYGAPLVSRQGEEVYVSVSETGADVPPLCNTRWQLWHREADGWKLAQSEKQYRQREPCPIATFYDGAVFLSANPSTQPPGTKYGPCHPYVLEFNPKDLSAAPKVSEPAWANGTTFTDHSYRGFTADGAKGELLLLNINAKTGAQFVSYRDARGAWHAEGKITFPIRACYPQAALRNRAAHVMAIGDIVEPVEEWRKLKFEKLKSEWDYVFRRLFYTYTPDITAARFVAPIEIDSAEKTAGYIANLDLHVDQAGAAHLLYLRRPHQYEFIRDKYFPGQLMTASLEYAVVRGGRVIARRTLAETPRGSKGLDPSYARFHVGPGDALYVVVAGTAPDETGRPTFGNHVARIPAGDDRLRFSRVKLKHPFGMFFTNTPRGGSRPSDLIDLFGIAEDNPNLRYARVRLSPTAGQ